jgi:hypothetical protein
MPVSILMVVDLPAPLGPMKASISPLGSEKVMSATAVIAFSSARHNACTLPRNPGAFCFTLNVFVRPDTFTTTSFITHLLRGEWRLETGSVSSRNY